MSKKATVVFSVLVSVAIFAVGLPACGGSGSDNSSRVVPKAQFVKEATAICKRAHDQRLQVLASAASSIKPGTTPTKADQEEVIVTHMLPVYREMTTDLAELTPPEGDEETVDEIITALEETANRIEAKPLDGNLDEVSALAVAYGIPDCGE